MCDIHSKSNAIKWLNSLVCEGGTEVLKVLEDVYMTLKASPGAIILMTDGEVGNTDQIIKLVKANKKIKVFTIGIGDNVSQQLVKGIAEASGAVSEFISGDNDQLKEKVMAQLNRSQSKCQENNKLMVNTKGSFRMVPELVNLYEGDVNTFYVFSTDPIESVTYSQIAPDGLSETSTVIQATSISIPVQ